MTGVRPSPPPAKIRKPIKPSDSEADKKTVDRKAWADLLKKNKK